MGLTPGTRLGVYEITAQIGVGGMGEVYKATDTILGRQVAIKILPDAFASDSERLARFEREAKTLASLNHPNIAQIYGFEKSSPSAGSGQAVPALVMELVEGPTLADRITRSGGPKGPPLRTEEVRAASRRGGSLDPPISIDEALAIARQIAEALAAAHEQGIIHRDLKPANIKVRPDGMVKVLDFGLAKAMDPVGRGFSPAGPEGPAYVPLSQSPTITSPALMTGAGVILGTAAYMSPEQARGKAVDKRADIWAFGAVLFEMLTGQRPFDGEDMTEVLGAVVRLEPPWDALPPDVPLAIRTLLQSCLVKDPRRRVADISTALFVLDKAASLTVAPVAVGPVTPPSSASDGRLAWRAALVVAVVALGSLAIPATRHLTEIPPPETRVEINTPASERPADFALSPDGSQIVFVASGDGASRLWLRSLATTAAQPLAGTEGGRFPFWSPDGRSIGFFNANALQRLDLGGGVPQTLAPVFNGSGGTWNADGVIVFAPGITVPLMRVSATGGDVVPVTTLAPQQVGHASPHFLPGGRRFLFRAQGAPDVTGIYLGALDGTAPARLTSDGTGAYLPSGWLLRARAGTLVAQRLDPAQAALTGEPVTVADGVVDSGFGAAVSVAATGLVAYRTGAGRQRQLTWVDRSGTERGTIGDPDGNNLIHPRVSPDGRRVVAARTVQGNVDLWLFDGPRTSRFTFDAAFDQFPIWSPDGMRVIFHSNRTGRIDLYEKLTSGAGVEQRIVASDQVKLPASWSADSRFLLYVAVDPQSNADLWVMPMTGDRKPSVFLRTPFRENWGAFSPAGGWVAYQSNESGRNEIYVRPFVPPGAAGTAASATGGQWQVSTAGGTYPVWRADGKELYYLNPAGEMMAAPIRSTASTLEPGVPVVLFPARIYGGGEEVQQGPQYDVAPDGRFLINTERDSAAAPITLLQNWNPEATR